ncbi:cytochrome P450 [Exidia glandulosa HHB12029]|uniref:Cytochrome P450 n=1 Tax=Exidia glandulosa HHB12029 TaxID=1314781 RepID=A0A165Q3F9_EXIGL|nr:cytochrome P450 [Exidia glandulosa HHB12029]
MDLPLSSLAAVGLVLVLFSVYSRRTARKLPPGPRGQFLVGNLRDAPRPPEEWKAYAAMSKEYGPVTYLRVLTKNVIVVNTMQAVTDLLEKRSAIYSDRPQLPMVDILGLGPLISLLPYGDQWKLYRRALHQLFNETAAKKWRGVHETWNARFLQRLADKPEDWWNLTLWLAGANIVELAYGREAADHNDPCLMLGIQSLEVASHVASFGTYLVDWIPALKYVPAWFPGAQFKRDGLMWRELAMRSKHLPFEQTMKDMAVGTSRPCVSTELLDRQLGAVSLSEDDVKNIAWVLYLAGADTTLSAMRAFVHAMVLNPSVQRSAQAELDRIVPRSRLPQMSDRPQLPYIDSVIRETLRKYPVAPLAIAHRLMEDDEYEGMHLPKGSTVVVNSWAIFHDEEVYPEPHLFQPERYLRDGIIDPAAPDPSGAAFGYGRRVCPGRHVADAELWMMIATVLSCFDISPSKKADGTDIIPSSTMCSGVVSMLGEFPCKMELRDEAKRQLILDEVERVVST